MNPKDKYKKTLLTASGSGSSILNLGIPTAKSLPSGGGGGGSFGPTKPTNSTGLIGAQGTGTPQSSTSTLTLGANNPYGLNKPSKAWQDFGKTMKVEAGGKVVSTPITPSDTSATGTSTPSLASTGSSRDAYLSNLMNEAKGISAQIPGMTTSENKDEEWKNSPEYKQYLKYKRDQENPNEQSNLQTSMKNLADIQSEKERMEMEARNRYEDLLDKSGGTLAGAQQSAALDRRRSNQELADMALRESAAARTAGVYQTSAESAKKEGFSLGKDQVRYEYDPETGSYKSVGMGGGTPAEGAGGAYTPGSNPTIDSYVKAIQDGTAKISDVPDEYKDTVMQGLSSTQKPQSEISKQAIGVIGELLSNPKLDRIFGPADQFVGGIFGDAALAKNKYDQLKGLLSLDNIKYLKGTGAISDAEQRLLANAASALGRNLGNAQARQVLTQLRDDLTALQGQGGQNQGGEIVQTSAGPVNTNW